MLNDFGAEEGLADAELLIDCEEDPTLRAVLVRDVAGDGSTVAITAGVTPVAPRYEDLTAMSEADLIAAYNDEAPNVVVGLEWLRFELWRREAARQTSTVKLANRRDRGTHGRERRSRRSVLAKA